jgi:hypothetical protein
MGTAHNRASISLAAKEQVQNDRILTGVVWEQLKRQLEVATQGRCAQSSLLCLICSEIPGTTTPPSCSIASWVPQTC